MKIDANLHHNQNVDMEKTSYGNSYQKSTARIADVVGGYTLDISGTVTDNAAYGMGELKSADEVMQDAGHKDIALQRNYMAVMSNSMSAEDYAKLQDEGISAVDTDIDTHVTSLDKVKASLAQAGTVIAGYNDDLTDAQIEAIAGGDIKAGQLKEIFDRSDLRLSEDNLRGISDASDKAESIRPLTDEVKKYMVINNLEPTIANLYKAEYSAGTGTGRQARGYYMDSTDGYYAKKADDFDMDQIRGQVEGIINRAGLTVNDETMAEAEWIIKSGLPITETTIGSLDRLNHLSLPLTGDDIVNISAIAINDGQSPVNGAVDKAKPDHITAVRVQEELSAVTEEGLNRVIDSSSVLNIRNLYEASVKEDARSVTIPDSENAISARRQLEETRLIMSTEANLKLLKQGIAIDIEPLSRLVTELKEAERAYYEPRLISGSESDGENITDLLDFRIDTYKQTINAFEALKGVPAAVIGNADTASDDFTVRNLTIQGSALRASYENAGRSYETLMTAPRADMGDSIRKAFANVDEILEDNGYELNDANRRAVRILGYSGTAIDPESINRVREADHAVQRVMELMTPAKTLELIRDGFNPMDENIYLLAQDLERVKGSDNAERYSRFLRKLEEKNEISDKEKSAFIGVYRLLRQIEKSDGKLIGNVLSQGADLTLRNLLSASRSNRAKGMDVSVDDGFGALDELRTRGTSISEQIDSAFESSRSGNRTVDYLGSLVQEALDKLDPDGMERTGINLDRTLESFARDTIETYDKQAAQTERFEEDMRAINEARSVDDKVIGMLREYDQPVTVNNLIAANALMMDRGSTFRKLMEEGKKAGESSENVLRKAAEKLTDAFTSDVSAKEAYGELADEAFKIVEEAVDNNTGEVDVTGLKLLHKQIGISRSLADRQNYEIPVNINGEWTSINLRLISDPSQGGSVTATMDTARYGRVAAKFIMTGKECSGYITSDRQDGVDSLKELKDELSEMISQDGRSVKELDYMRSDRPDLNAFASEEGQGLGAASSDLYEVAKAFIKTISR